MSPAIALALLAQVATPSDIPKTPIYTAEGDKVICKQIWEAGSRIATRVCRTSDEWERMAKENQDDWRNSRNSRSVGCNRLDCV